MKTIPLTKGKHAIVDDDDYEMLSKLKWQYNSSGYAIRNINLGGGKYKSLVMHRVIFPTEPGFDVDHINGDRVDNRKENLRVATRSQNIRNMKKRDGTSSQYKGVSFNKRSGKWKSYINGKYLGLFDHEEDAAKVYNRHAQDQFGEFARFNEL